MQLTDYIVSQSMAMSSAQLHQSVSIATMKMAIDMQSEQTEAIAELLQVPASENLVDIMV